MKNNVFTVLGASNHSDYKREENDYYATEPKATKLLLEVEKFTDIILEPCCGEGHISSSLIEHGYKVVLSDLIDRGYGEVKNFFDIKKSEFDIITNPPYKNALKYVEHALTIVGTGNKVAMFLKIQFLEGKARKEFFKKYPPKKIYVSSSRLICARNGDFETFKSSAVCYAWYIWEKGYKGDTIIKWIN